MRLCLYCCILWLRSCLAWGKFSVRKAWKLGWTYNLHGIVVHTQPCSKDCVHDTLNCCAVVRFKPPAAEPGRIEVSLGYGFVQKAL